MPKISGENGQALLVVVLTMVVALTVGLSVVSKSITNLRTSTEEANSQKALAAAEAGIEQAIKNGVPIAQRSFTNNTTYSTDIKQVLGTSFLVNAGNPILQDSGADIWFSTYSEDDAVIYTSPWSGNLTIKWGNSQQSCSNAALEIAIVSGSKANPQVKRYAFDPCSSRASVNNFTAVPLNKSTLNGINFYYETTIPVSSGLIGKVVPLYANTNIGVVGSAALPLQGNTITSVGKSQDTERKVNVFQGFPEIPSEFFLYNLLSP